MKWTTEPPTEPGYYWFKSLPVGYTVIKHWPIHADAGNPTGWAGQGEWWPIKIEEPE